MSKERSANGLVNWKGSLHVLVGLQARSVAGPLGELCAAFPPEAGEAFLAYAEAESFVRYLRENYGASGLEALTGAYADGLGCEQGAQRALGRALTPLEQDWLAQGLGASTDRGDTPAEEPPTAGSILPFVILLALILIVPLAMAFSRRR
jgi:hypothetical protein